MAKSTKKPKPPTATDRRGRVTLAGVFVETQEIVENIRVLLAENSNEGDILRSLTAQFGGKTASFKKHLALARKRNLANLGRTPEAAKADSTQQWFRMQAEERHNQALHQAAVDQALARLAELVEAYEDAEGPAERSVALERVETQLALSDRCERRLLAARRAIERHQHTIDRILGNLAPIEYRDTGERKAEIASPTEPLTAKESDLTLAHLLTRLRGEMATPSPN